MLQATTIDTENHTVYTDISNNKKEVKHSVVLTAEDRRELEERIVDELCRIFTHKVG